MPSFSAISFWVNSASYNCIARRRRSASALPVDRFWAWSYSRLGSLSEPMLKTDPLLLSSQQKSKI